MDIKLHYYGMIAEKIGFDSENFFFDSNVFSGEMKSFFIERYPLLSGMAFQVAVDGQILNSFPETKFENIALLPPFAGG